MTERRDLLSVATRAARVGGSTILSAGRVREGVEKSAGDYVTAVDGASERAIAGFLSESTPDIPLVGEEGGGTTTDRYWLVDPLDGTTNFLHGFPIVAVSVALVEEGRPTVGVVHAPFLHETYTAASGEGAWAERADGTSVRLEVSRRAVDRAVVGTGFPFRHKDVLPRYYRALRAALERFEDLRRPGAAALDLAWVAAGKTNPAVADLLHISPRTVQTHLERIYRKLGVETRTAATARALEAMRDAPVGEA